MTWAAGFSRHSLALLAVGWMLTGCGGNGSDATPKEQKRGIPLVAPPPVVRTFCSESTKPVPVLCPSRYPGRRGPAAARDRRDLSGRDFTPSRYPGYLVNFNDAGARTSDRGHLVLAAQPRPVSLAGQPGDRWPQPGERPDPELRLGSAGTVVRRATVGGRQALVVRAEPYPEGGIHGGHVMVLWNEGGNGYLLSLHYAGGRERYSEWDRITAALAIATAAGH